MPELPDVEGHRIALTNSLPGARIETVHVLDAGVLRNATSDEFVDRLVGHTFGTPDRLGKWLILPTDGPTVLIHNGMTGRPYVIPCTRTDAEPDRYDRLVVATDLGALHYADLRKLRGVWLVDRRADVPHVIGEHGPDALDVSEGAFRAALDGRRGVLKTLLMNQQVIAGLGNMLSDETCWRARMHPSRTLNSLDDADLHGLYLSMRRVVRAAAKQGTIPRTASWLNSARDRVPANCPRCGTTLQRTPIAGRTSIWCPRCQPPGNV